VASSFYKTANNDKLLFAILDFKDGKETFRKLQITNAPTLYYYPPTDGSGKVDIKKYEFNHHGFEAEALANVLSSWTGYPIPVHRPFNYLGLALGIFGFLAVSAAIRVMYPYLSMIATNRHLWAFISLGIILLMNSGHMWNHIRKPPYIISNKGQISYISQGFSQQLGLESQIVAVIYGILAFSTASLAISVPRLPSASKQRVAVYVWMGCVFVVFSFLMQLFKIKNGGYPFNLLF
jgi:oligosaccharyltransferase complex subunit gamma